MTMQLRLDGTIQLPLAAPKPFALEPYHYACKCGRWATVGVPDPLCEVVVIACCERCAKQKGFA